MTDEQKSVHVHLVDGQMLSIDASGASDDAVTDIMHAAVDAEGGWIHGPLRGEVGFAMVPARSVLYCVAKGLDAQVEVERSEP